MLGSSFGPVLVQGNSDAERIPRWMAAVCPALQRGLTTSWRDLFFRDKVCKDIIKAIDGIRHCEDPVKIAHHDIYGQPSVNICYDTHFERLMEADGRLPGVESPRSRHEERAPEGMYCFGRRGPDNMDPCENVDPVAPPCPQ